MKRLIILGIVIMGLGLFLAGQSLDKNTGEIRLVEEKIVKTEYSGVVSRLVDGEEAFYYRYSFPRDVIEEKFSMDDITDEFYEEIADYERVGEDEYLVELQGVGKGVVVHKGADEVTLVIVERDNLIRVKDAMRENKLLDGKIAEKLKLLEDILLKK